ncbi:MAG TPA: hydroxymethylbilane synthase [Candidatus Binataceae bacterium]|jgi:hydroxymethylbilane synthase|nr:hydroxymethylbilane synthase [Candidatus Binataceae bacterium]
MSFRLRIGSRPSPLALAQANLVKRLLQAALPGLDIELVAVSTSGDKLTTPSLAQIGGKGLFIRELEQALVSHQIDIAVHSMKDLPAVLPAEFRLAAVPPRENPCDALITRAGGGWTSLKPGARLGTSSTRRRLEALRLRPDLNVIPLRGNVDTRLERLAAGGFDAIILALAGLHRLGKSGVVEYLELDQREFVPCGGQGALAIEVLAAHPLGGAPELEGAVASLTDARALAEVTAERAFLAAIGASCVSPVGVRSSVDGGVMNLYALLFSADGARHLADEISTAYRIEDGLAGSAPASAAIGAALGQRMIDRGARELIAGA